MNLEDFFNITRDDVENKITTTISDEKIREILNGGKRLRSVLTQLTFKACTEGKDTHEDYQKSLEGGVSIELAHGASLVHDDIIDEDSERRGKQALHVKEGIGKAILTGHRMLAIGFDIALNHGKELAKLYVDSWNEVVNGEIDEVEFNKNGLKQSKENSLKSTIFEAYNKIIDLKTASLFSSACEAGALEANMSGEILKVFKTYGREIGLAYQLADDLVDLANGEMIDSVIIPILNKLEKKPIKKTSLKRWEIKRKFAKNEDKIRKYYIEEIKDHVRKAEEISKSKHIPHSSYKQLLTEAPSYIINRMLSEINITV
jgi:octaprenyl-diphosphate synthase